MWASRAAAAFIVALSATSALAQEVAIPLAVSLPSTFVVDETRAVEVDVNGTHVAGSAHARYTLSLNAKSGSYDAVLTLVSLEVSVPDKAEQAALLRLALPRQALLNQPVELSLGQSGEPTEITNFEAVQQRLRVASGSAGLSTAEQFPPTLLALVSAPLGVMSPCQNTNLHEAEPVRRVSETPIANTSFMRIVRTEKVLQSVDSQSSTANISFNRVQGMRDAVADPNAALLHQLTSSSTCVVDLRTGLVRTATYEAVGEDGFALRSEIVIMPQ